MAQSTNNTLLDFSPHDQDNSNEIDNHQLTTLDFPTDRHYMMNNSVHHHHHHASLDMNPRTMMRNNLHHSDCSSTACCCYNGNTTSPPAPPCIVEFDHEEALISSWSDMVDIDNLVVDEDNTPTGSGVDDDEYQFGEDFAQFVDAYHAEACCNDEDEDIEMSESFVNLPYLSGEMCLLSEHGFNDYATISVVVENDFEFDNGMSGYQNQPILLLENETNADSSYINFILSINGR